MTEEQSFEEIMAQLETLVRKLESGDVPLEEGFQAYDNGMKLVAAAKKLLQGYELRVEKIINAQGDTEEFEE